MKTKLILTILLLMLSTSLYPHSSASTIEPLEYVAKLSASGGAIPSAIVLESTLTGPLVWTRITEGRYRCTLAGAFSDETKISGLREYHFVDGGKWRLSWDDETETSGDSLILESYTSDGVLSDGILSLTEIHIKVYPE